MIKFFRKIRFKLMETGLPTREGTVDEVGKTTKPASQRWRYFKYAIGEIVLVVIGILIALSINNWNEQRKEASNETKILKTLNAEFSHNSFALDTVLERLYGMEQALTFVFRNIKPKPNLNFSSNQIDSLLNKTLSNPYWTRSEYALRNLESSGKISTLSSELLKNKLYEWSLVATDIEDKESDFSRGFNNLLSYYKENGSLRNLDFYAPYITESRTQLEHDHFKFFSDIVFENAIDDCIIYTRQRIRRYEKAKGIIDQIIEITQTEE